jgi:hypothetical protein
VDRLVPRALGHPLALFAVIGAGMLSGCGAEDIGREVDSQVEQTIRDPMRVEREARRQKRNLNRGFKEAERLTR